MSLCHYVSSISLFSSGVASKSRWSMADDPGSQKNAAAEAIRKEWIAKSVIPLLKGCQILNGFSTKLVSKIAAPLLKTSFLGISDIRFTKNL